MYTKNSLEMNILYRNNLSFVYNLVSPEKNYYETLVPIPKKPGCDTSDLRIGDQLSSPQP